MQSESTLILDPVLKEPGTGDLVNGYLLGQLLGRGAQGSVYRANRTKDHREFAIKVISLQGKSESFIDRVIRECSITTKLRHPGIMTVHEADYWGASLYIVMDIAVGQAGDQYKDGSLGWERVAEIGRRVALALGSAYATARIIHRDIKPANLMVDINEGGIRGVKVVDFGLGRSVDDQGGDLTLTGMILGTPYYMSPEQAQGERTLGFQTDMYALGATMFHLIAGKPPFMEGTPVEILLAHCKKPPPRLDRLVRDCPADLAEVVQRCLAKQPKQRYSTYAALVSDLDIVLGRSPFDINPFDMEDIRGAEKSTNKRYQHRAIAASPVGGGPSAESSHGEGSATAADALASLFRTKVTETSRIYQRKNGIEPTAPNAAKTPATQLPSLQPRFVIPGTKPPTKRISRWADDEAPLVDPVIIEEEPEPEPDKDDDPKRPPTLALGTVIDQHFEITGVIGAGAMGEVYAVEDRMTKRPLALKILFPEDMAKAGIVLRFQSEASALATVDHPAFPYFAGKGQIDGRDYLMMERVAGADLKSYVKTQGGRLSELKTLHILLQLARAMHRANEVCGMVHRDIKPANLMITDPEELTLRIIDFGVSTYINYGDFEDF